MPTPLPTEARFESLNNYATLRRSPGTPDVQVEVRGRTTGALVAGFAVKPPTPDQDLERYARTATEALLQRAAGKGETLAILKALEALCY